MRQCLAIETSSRTGSVALARGEEIIERPIPSPREQTALVLGLVDELLRAAGIRLADLDALVFGRGPGSFTGLRVAAAVVQGLSFASGVPIVPVSSLAALAQRGLDARSAASAAKGVLCVVDAHMGEVYWASFRLEDGLAVPVCEERIGPPEAVSAPAEPFIALGDGFGVHADALGSVLGRALAADPAAMPGARQLLAQGFIDVEAGRFTPLESAVPVYLREAAAWQRA